MAISLCYFFPLLCLAVVGTAAAAQEGCKPAQCQHSGPAVRFPFWLKGHQPQHCGFPHPGFELSCSPSNATELDFQYPIPAYQSSRLWTSNNTALTLQVRVQVREIDYKSQQVYLSPVSVDYCPLNNLSNHVSPFKIQDEYFNLRKPGNLALFNCSSHVNGSRQWLFSCLSGRGYQVIAFDINDAVFEYGDLSSCTMIYDISGVPFTDLDRYLRKEDIYLQWRKPSCRDCEAQGKYCRLKDSSRDDETQCFVIPTLPRNGISRKLILAVVIGTLSLVLAIVILLNRIISLKNKKDDQKKIDKFLEDYKALRPTRFTYADVKKITDKFKEKLGEGGYGTVYKGKLSNDILVAVKVLNNFKGNGEEFINEVRTIGTIHHVNVVRLVGYCADGYRRALLYEFLPNDSLEKLISSRKQINSLGWEKLKQIVIGIAKGLDYLHQDCNQRILHFDIKPQNILLDHNFNPKVADFGLAKLCSKDQSAISMTVARGTIGYIAPEVFSRNFGNVSYKSDVYSFGMLLLDMVGGRKRFEAAREEDSSQIYYPEWMYKQLEKGEELEIQIDNVEDSGIFKKLAIVGLWCIQWCPADRPSVKIAIQMLEGENMPAIPPNPFAAGKSAAPNAFTNGGEICTISGTT